ncbi:MAG: DUF721 domain-containing protein [Rhodobacteraceae bacterium]|nr:DUF721 domain-containing protein [Paracoccaceae bacterium]
MAKAGLLHREPASPPPRVGRPTAIGAVFARAAAPALAKRGFSSASLIQNWAEIVGRELADLSAPLQVKISRGRNDGGTLVLKAAHGSAATLMQMKIPAVIERVNRYFGYPAIARVQMTQGVMAAHRRPRRLIQEEAPRDATREKAIETLVAEVGPPDLKAALARLGDAVSRRKP